MHLIEDMSQIQISTIHKFAISLLKGIVCEWDWRMTAKYLVKLIIEKNYIIII